MKSEVNLRTTINFNCEKLIYWKEKCNKHGISITDLIKKSLALYLRNEKKLTNKWHTISYQEKGLSYKKLHFTMKPAEYDIYMDAKKFHRLSFSFIVTIALDLYANVIIEGKDEQCYPFYGYTKIYIKKNNYTFFILCWGVPTKPITLEVIEV
jgi:hypothetical protein